MKSRSSFIIKLFYQFYYSHYKHKIDGLVQDYSIWVSIADALEVLQSCIKPLR